MKKIFMLCMTVLFFFSFANMEPEAAHGDFYKKNQNEFKLLSEDQKKFVKKYDLDTNSFDCGFTEVACPVNGFFYSTIIGLLTFLVNGLGNILVTPDWFLNEPEFAKYIKFFDSMTLSLFAMFVIWQIAMGYAKNATNLDEMDTVVNEKFMKMIGGAMFLGLYTSIFKTFMEIQSSISEGIFKFSANPEAFAIITFKYAPKFSLFVIFFICIIMAIFLIALTYRFIAFSFMYVVGPVAITTIVNEEFNYFSIWLKYIVNNLVTLTLQLMCFVMAIGCITLQYQFIKNFGPFIDLVMGIIFACGFCIFALVIPGILGNLGGSSGTGRSIGKMLRVIAMRR